MQWTVQVIVVLLNIVWIIFFLQPDPPSVFVQRRSSDSSDEEVHFGEFCIRPQSDMKWTQTEHSVNITSNKTNNSNTTAEANRRNNFTLDESHSVNTTNTKTKDLKSLQSSEINYRRPGPESEPDMISSEAAGVGVTHQSKPPVQEKDSQDEKDPGTHVYFECCFKLFTGRIPRTRIKKYYRTSSFCQKKAIVLITIRHREICVDPQSEWVQNVVKDIK